MSGSKNVVAGELEERCCVEDDAHQGFVHRRIRALGGHVGGFRRAVRKPPRRGECVQHLVREWVAETHTHRVEPSDHLDLRRQVSRVGRQISGDVVADRRQVRREVAASFLDPAVLPFLPSGWLTELVDDLAERRPYLGKRGVQRRSSHVRPSLGRRQASGGGLSRDRWEPWPGSQHGQPITRGDT